MIDPRSAATIATLLPPVQIVATSFIENVNAAGLLPAGWVVKAISGTRTFEAQTALYAQGRNGVPGKIVTNAPAGYSLHNFGIAFDVGIFNNSGQYEDDVMPNDDPFYIKLAPVGRALALEWGGDWAGRLQDYPHYQYNPAHLTLTQMRYRRATGGNLLVQ